MNKEGLAGGEGGFARPHVYGGLVEVYSLFTFEMYFITPITFAFVFCLLGCAEGPALYRKSDLCIPINETA